MSVSLQLHQPQVCSYRSYYQYQSVYSIYRSILPSLCLIRITYWLCHINFTLPSEYRARLYPKVAMRLWRSLKISLPADWCFWNHQRAGSCSTHHWGLSLPRASFLLSAPFAYLILCQYCYLLCSCVLKRVEKLEWAYILFGLIVSFRICSSTISLIRFETLRVRYHWNLGFDSKFVLVIICAFG